jgi:ribose 5-phosphate isomerase RpiB
MLFTETEDAEKHSFFFEIGTDHRLINKNHTWREPYVSRNIVLIDVTQCQKESKKDNNKAIFDSLMKSSNANMITLSKRITLKGIMKRATKSFLEKNA